MQTTYFYLPFMPKLTLVHTNGWLYTAHKRCFLQVHRLTATLDGMILETFFIKHPFVQQSIGKPSFFPRRFLMIQPYTNDKHMSKPS